MYDGKIDSFKRLRKEVRKRYRGWPIATIALNGPNLSQATKVDPPELSESLLRHWKPRARGQGRGGPARGRVRHLLVPPFNGPEVRRRGCSYTGVELSEHRQTQLLDRLATWQKAMAR